jgi:hypothetical protein
MKDHLQFSPLRIFDSAAGAMRIYGEWLTGDVAWSMQVSPRIKITSAFPYRSIGSAA